MSTPITPNAPHHEGLGSVASRYVPVNDMPWETTRFPGIEAKTLLFDPETGIATVLLKMAPGACLPHHEHVQVEQTFVLEGRLVDKAGPDEGLSVGPGDFVWRPAGSRHTAWTPEGGLMLAVFQVPNKFLDEGGEVVDMLGQNWDETWGHTVRTKVAQPSTED